MKIGFNHLPLEMKGLRNQNRFWKTICTHIRDLISNRNTKDMDKLLQSGSQKEFLESESMQSGIIELGKSKNQSSVLLDQQNTQQVTICLLKASL